MSKVSVSETDAENWLGIEHGTSVSIGEHSTLSPPPFHCSTEDKKLITLFYLNFLQFLNFFATGYFVQEEGIRFGSPEQTFERSLEASRSKESRPPTQIGSREFFRYL